QPPPHTLLHLLLRHSMLLEYTSAASRLLVGKKLLEPTVLREPELVDLPVGQLMHSIWRQMAMKITVEGQAEPIEVSKDLLGFLPTGEPDTARVPDLKQISEFRASLAHLKSLNVRKLETLMAGTLDLSSHRLDAWITSIATKRLLDMRKVDAKGILFGGYGWVMNLTPAPPQTKMATPPAGEKDPVFEQASNPGFVHTPSLAQASTAAILRSGHLAHAGAAKQMPNDLLAIDLSSERARLAIWLLDGVRQGQPLGALLGYRFERRLQETKIPEFIAPLRELVPLVARKFEQPNQPVAVEAIAANNVVDGLGLLRRWQKGRSTQPELWDDTTIPFGRTVGGQTTKLPNLNDPKFEQLTAELKILEEAVDSVSDALVAEGVYQIVRGNPLRAASTVESIAGGEAPPPELEVVRTPRTGIAFTHRVLTLFSGPPATLAGWGPPEHSFRADAEPHLNAWLAKLLGSPANVRCVVELLHPATKEVVDRKDLRLDQLKLSPLDFVYALEGGQGGQQAEIEQRILYRAVQMENGFAPGSLLRINPARQPEWKIEELSYGEFSELLRTARKVLNGSRYVDDGDLNPPERSTDFSMDVAELGTRATNATKALTDTATQFDQEPATPANANLETLRKLIIRAGAFGIAGAVPLAAGDSADDRALLLAQASSIRKELAQRVDQVQKLVSGFNAGQASDEQKRDHALAQLRIVFGKAFIVLPRFTATNRQELKQALANKTLLEKDPLAAATWFQRTARVRDGVAKINAALTYADALNTGEKLNLTIAQLPHDDKDRWVGLPLDNGTSLPGGKLSLVIQADNSLNVQQPLAGLFIDEWVEVVPGTSEITGLALQYDQPSAAPPQTILLAVPPDLEVSWTVWSLQQVLLETLDLARIRGVDLDVLGEVNHYLPASYFAFNTAGETVSTDFTTIKKPV
ncbi:MAG TPA: hypothetical protein VFT02_06855, partial [Pyrinomonadaceae bacterium]|nr:hypothetical protein [Pyrinomonadaceae bacterium]